MDFDFTVGIMSILNEIKGFETCLKHFNLERLTDANIITTWFEIFFLQQVLPNYIPFYIKSFLPKYFELSST